MQKKEEIPVETVMPFMYKIIEMLNRELWKSKDIVDQNGEQLPPTYFLGPLMSYMARLYYDTLHSTEFAEREMTKAIQIGKEIWAES